MSAELIKQKLEIAKRAGELDRELSELTRAKKIIESKKYSLDPVHVVLGNHDTLSSHRWEGDGTSLHDLMLGYIDAQIDSRLAQVNDLIKVLQ